MADESFFGTARDSSSASTFTRAEKIKEGTTRAQVIPPIKSLRDSGRFSAYHKIHFGHYVPNKKTPGGKAWPRPFLCIEQKNYKTGMISQACPKCDEIKQHTDSADAREAEIRSENKGKTDSAIKQLLAADPLLQLEKGWLKMHWTDGHYYVNLKTASGDIVCTKITGKLHKALLLEKARLAAKGVDAFSPTKGVFFDFFRGSEGDINTTYTVTVAKEEVADANGEPLERTKYGSLQNDIEEIKAKALDLATAHNATVLTEAQIRDLIALDSSDLEATAAFFDRISGSRTEAEADVAPVVEAPRPVAAAPKKAAPAPAPAPLPPMEEVDEEADIEAQVRAQVLAAMKAKKKAISTPAPSAAAAADDFLAQYAERG